MPIGTLRQNLSPSQPPGVRRKFKKRVLEPKVSAFYGRVRNGPAFFLSFWCLISALEIANLRAEKCLISLRNLLLFWIDSDWNIRQQSRILSTRFSCYYKPYFLLTLKRINGSSDWSAPGSVQGINFKFEKFPIPKTISLTLESFDFIVGAFQRTGWDLVIVVSKDTFPLEFGNSLERTCMSIFFN